MGKFVSILCDISCCCSHSVPTDDFIVYLNLFMGIELLAKCQVRIAITFEPVIIFSHKIILENCENRFHINTDQLSSLGQRETFYHIFKILLSILVHNFFNTINGK